MATNVPSVETINLEEVHLMVSMLVNTEVKSIGQGRGAGFDRMILLKKMVVLHKKSDLDLSLFCEIAKTFAIKFALQGTRIKPDNTVMIQDIEYNAAQIASLFEFKLSGKNTDQTQLTPTRMARLFATDAVLWAEQNNFDPPMYLQEDLRVLGLPRNWHFLAACYANGASQYKEHLITLGKNFDTKLADAIEGFDKKNGFGMRMKWWFDHYDEGKLFGEFAASMAKAPIKRKEQKQKTTGTAKTTEKQT